MNLLELVEKEKSCGYNEANASAKVCQDLILKAISNSPLRQNITVKGGVVMRCLTNNIRRATQDLDLDFIKHSISDQSIDEFINDLNNIDGIVFSRIYDIEELNQQDYHGKRAYIQISDKTKNLLRTKLDIGVHKKIEIEQEEYYFDFSFSDEGAILLINSHEQMFCEKLCSLLKFGPASTRYKDIFDMSYLVKHIDRDKLQECLESYIYSDENMRENNLNDIIKRLDMTFNNKVYQRRINTSDKNWIDYNVTNVFQSIMDFLESMTYSLSN